MQESGGSLVGSAPLHLTKRPGSIPTLGMSEWGILDFEEKKRQSIVHHRCFGFSSISDDNLRTQRHFGTYTMYCTVEAEDHV